jgi:hypothetical protein
VRSHRERTIEGNRSATESLEEFGKMMEAGLTDLERRTMSVAGCLAVGTYQHRIGLIRGGQTATATVPQVAGPPVRTGGLAGIPEKTQ